MILQEKAEVEGGRKVDWKTVFKQVKGCHMGKGYRLHIVLVHTADT